MSEKNKELPNTKIEARDFLLRAYSHVGIRPTAESTLASGILISAARCLGAEIGAEQHLKIMRNLAEVGKPFKD